MFFLTRNPPEKRQELFYPPTKTPSLGKNLRGVVQEGRFMPKGSCVARGVGIVGARENIEKIW